MSEATTVQDFAEKTQPSNGASKLGAPLSYVAAPKPDQALSAAMKFDFGAINNSAKLEAMIKEKEPFKSVTLNDLKQHVGKEAFAAIENIAKGAKVGTNADGSLNLNTKMDAFLGDLAGKQLLNDKLTKTIGTTVLGTVLSMQAKNNGNVQALALGAEIAKNLGVEIKGEIVLLNNGKPADPNRESATLNYNIFPTTKNNQLGAGFKIGGNIDSLSTSQEQIETMIKAAANLSGTSFDGVTNANAEVKLGQTGPYGLGAQITSKVDHNIQKNVTKLDAALEATIPIADKDPRKGGAALVGSAGVSSTFDGSPVHTISIGYKNEGNSVSLDLKNSEGPKPSQSLSVNGKFTF